MPDIARAFEKLFGMPLMPMPHRLDDFIEPDQDDDPHGVEADLAAERHFNR